ncbi:hypothetical protein MMA231_00721 [Asticcacaulis sp. MM231]|uniref:hypothetical protein n=1 Tax=Asticcacaulis sp. MM231 TaxID=3157666 RepID=UPI0032D59EE8
MKTVELTQWADEGLNALQRAVDKATDRKRKLGQYWVEWDGEKAVEIHPEDSTKTAAE